ncbi:putative Laccase domain protein in ftsZ 3'region [Candidatus Microthrix parvicella RN1]|jgi:YfiH family protein|uniref:Putative Laccase domain protein in ftsZ 3'region n=1 Tax=Candidatus Neomicrothrix parvicella RN1 TaxID=1229780 RepID=R4YX27_9ACTN|nr:putative Laccase domain protein in ftsZ 3'region [Candidatus Microthrix parvicella RN1]
MISSTVTTTSTFPPSSADRPFVDGVDLSNGGAVRWCFTGRTQGDLSEAAPQAVTRLGETLGVPIHTVHQVHGDQVVVLGADDVDPSGRAVSPHHADALVTSVCDVGLGVRTADCAPVVLWSDGATDGGVIGAAHGGWSGLEAGIVEATAESMRSMGATHLSAVLGPCIGPECYEFADADLDRLVGRFGPTVRSVTDSGAAALDLRAAVAAACQRAEVQLRPGPPACTACGGSHYSHRARGERMRQLGIVWRTR